MILKQDYDIEEKWEVERLDYDIEEKWEVERLDYDIPEKWEVERLREFYESIYGFYFDEEE